MMDDRVAKLEEKIAFLEQALQELSEEYFAQQKQLNQLARRVEAIADRVKNQSDSSDISDSSLLTDSEVPPHY